MAKNEHYLDSCIWLNLFKKEGDPTKGIPYWKLAKDFIEQVEDEKGKIIVSTIILKELYFTLGEKFDGVKGFLKEAGYVNIIKTTSDDYDLAREFEQQHGLISFYDYLHVAIAKRLGIPLITRDRDLMDFAKNHVKVFKPEDLLS
ncbi:PIN domain-containing protein [Candidatus Woesearchaeota archaeon]|nr:PIN domain-containing protein [Candidatus Woesearchaeota archaeon]